HGGSDEYAMLPIVRLENERCDSCSAATEYDRRDGNTLRVIPMRRNRRALANRRRESRVGMRSRPVVRRPRPPLPIDQARGRLAADSLPPRFAVGRERDVSKQTISTECCHCVWITLGTSSGCDSEKPGLRI